MRYLIFKILSSKLRSDSITYYLYAWNSPLLRIQLSTRGSTLPCLVFVPRHFLIKTAGHPAPALPPQNDGSRIDKVFFLFIRQPTSDLLVLYRTDETLSFGILARTF